MNNILCQCFMVSLSLIIFLTGCSIEKKTEASVKVIEKKPLIVVTQKQFYGEYSGFHNLQPSLSKNIVVYFNPHADDETLTFGVPIRNDLIRNKKVYVVLLSEGEDSIARDLVNGRFDNESYFPSMAGKPQWCNYHQRFHEPHFEDYQPLTQTQFGKERITEFFRSSTALGVPKEQLFYHRLPNGKFEYKKVRSILKDWISLFPNATFKTMSKRDIHKDHAMVGKVLKDLKNQKEVDHTVHYLSVATQIAKGTKDYKTIPLKNKQDVKLLKKSIAVYGKWDPENHYFALGFHSVPTQFEYLLKKKTSVQTPN